MDALREQIMLEELYVGTFFGVSMYVEHLYGIQINYIFRNEFSESIVVQASSRLTLDAPTDGLLYFGTFFNAEMYIEYADGSPIQYIFKQVQQPLPTPLPTPQPRIIPQREINPVYTAITHQADAPPQQSREINLFDFFLNNSLLIIFLAGLFFLYFTYAAYYNYKNKRMLRRKKDETMYDLAMKTDKALKKYKEAKLYQNYLEKHKLDPSPDSLFRKVPPEAAHYNSNKWSANPQLHNGIDLSLHNNDKTNFCCPKCNSGIIIRKNPSSKLNNYVCSSDSCGFQTLDKIFLIPNTDPNITD